MIEMVYHLQLNEAWGRDEVHGRGTGHPIASTVLVRRCLLLLTGARLFELTRRQFALQWGEMQADIEKEIKRREAMSAARGRAPALELRDVRKSFGKTEIIRGANLAVKPGERVAIIGPNGAGKSTLFNLISGRFGPPAARSCCMASASTA
jgi:ABC-type transport system involved in cytochrome bd biosynthesis fused ATPase/permease subunit